MLPLGATDTGTIEILYPAYHYYHCSVHVWTMMIWAKQIIRTTRIIIIHTLSDHLCASLVAISLIFLGIFKMWLSIIENLFTITYDLGASASAYLRSVTHSGINLMCASRRNWGENKTSLDHDGLHHMRIWCSAYPKWIYLISIVCFLDHHDHGERTSFSFSVSERSK